MEDDRRTQVLSRPHSCNGQAGVSGQQGGLDIMSDNALHRTKLCDTPRVETFVVADPERDPEPSGMEVIEPEKVGAEQDCLQTAAIWISRINSGQPSSQLLVELRNWLNERPENYTAFRQMEHLWSRLGAVRDVVLRSRTRNDSNQD